MCLSTLYNAGLLHFNVVALLLLGQIINRVTISFWKLLTQPADAIFGVFNNIFSRYFGYNCLSRLNAFLFKK